MRAIVPLQPAGHASVFSEDNGRLDLRDRPRERFRREGAFLSGNNRLVKDFVAKLRPESGRRHEVDLVADEVAKLPLKANEFKEANRPAKLNEQVDIAIVSTFIAGERPEQ
jgi:hypothetical protein